MNFPLQRVRKHLRHVQLIDWFIIIAVTCIVLFLISLTLNRSRWITIEFKVTLSPEYFPRSIDTPLYWISNKIRAGDAQYDNLGQKNLKVLGVTSWGYQYLQTWVRASVNVKYNPREKKYSFQYQPLEIGRPIDVVINGTNIHGIVTAIEGISDERKTYDITVTARLIEGTATLTTGTRGVDPWIADAVEVENVMKNTSGKVVAEILDRQIKPAERVVTTSDGRIVVGEDPFKKDVNLTLRLKVTKINDTYLFLEDSVVKIGGIIPIYLNRVMLSPVITNILD